MNIKVILFHVLAFAIMFLSPFILALSNVNPILTFLSSLVMFMILSYLLCRRTCMEAEKWKIISLILGCFLIILGIYMALRGFGFTITWSLWKNPEWLFYVEDLEAYRREAWKEMIYWCYTKKGIPEWFVYIDMVGIPIGVVWLFIGTLTSLKVIWKIKIVEGLLIVILSLILEAVITIIVFDLTPYGITLLGMLIPRCIEFLIPIILIGLFFSLNTTFGAIFYLKKKFSKIREEFAHTQRISDLAVS